MLKGAAAFKASSQRMPRKNSRRPMTELARQPGREAVQWELDAVDAPLLLLDRNGRILRVNGSCSERIGYAAAELTGHPIWSCLLPQGEVMGFKEAFAHALESETASRFAGSWVARDGSERPAVWSMRAQYSGSGDLSWLVVTLSEPGAPAITALGGTGLARVDRASQRIAANGQMASGLAHEINNPLASIKSAFLLVQAGVATDHPAHGYIERIDHEIDRIAAVIRQMVALYRPEPGAPSRTPLGATLRAAVADLEPKLATPGVDIQVMEPEHELFVTARETSLRRILRGLLENAVEASPSGGTVRAELQARERDVVISISDRGAGIPESIRARIFEPFFTTKRKPGEPARGLGLAAGRDHVEVMGGRLEFESEQGCGTRFDLILPSAGDRGGAA